MSVSHQVPRAPLPASGRYPNAEQPRRLPRRALPLRHCSYGLMCQALPPPSAYRFPSAAGPCSLSPVTAGGGPSQPYLCNPCVGAWTLTPPCSTGALAHCFPADSGLALERTSSAHGTLGFSGLQSFHYVQAPTLARPPFEDFYATHRPGSLPAPGRGIATCPNGQLTLRDFHPLDCSLVGCSSLAAARATRSSLDLKLAFGLR